MSLSVEEMNKQLPVANALPGEAVPYYMASGEGARYELNGQLVTVIARAADTGGIFSAAYISGGMGAESPFVTHAIEHKTLYASTASSTSGCPARPHPDPGAPRPGGGITSASAAVGTPQGRISSAWNVTGGTFTLDVELPAASGAQRNCRTAAPACCPTDRTASPRKCRTTAAGATARISPAIG